MNAITNIDVNNQIEQVEMVNHFKFSKDEDILQIVNIPLCTQLKEKIGQTKTDNEIITLNIIEIISDRGELMTEKWKLNQFSDQFSDSGLVWKIKDKILQEINELKKIDEDNWIKSEQIFQLVSIFCMMRKCTEIDKQMLDICGEVLYYQINYLYESLKRISEKQTTINTNENKIIEERIEYQLKKGQQILRLLLCLTEYSDNRDYLVDVYKIDQILIHLIHLNCLVKENCPKCIILPNSTELYLFQASVIRSFSSLTFDHQQISNNLKEFILPHLSPIIISFAQFKEDKQIPPYSQYLVEACLEILWILLMEDQLFISQMISTNNLVASFIQLMNYNRKNIHDLIYHKISSEIRQQSTWCIFWVVQYGNNQEEKCHTIKSQRYINSLLDALGVGGGCLEENCNVIYESFDSLNEIFIFLRNGPPNQDHKVIQKEIEGVQEESGNVEECETHLYHMINMRGDDVFNRARDFQETRINSLQVNKVYI